MRIKTFITTIITFVICIALTIVGYVLLQDVPKEGIESLALIAILPTLIIVYSILAIFVISTLVSSILASMSYSNIIRALSVLILIITIMLIVFNVGIIIKIF